MDMPHSFTHSFIDGHLHCFYFLAIMNNGTLNIHIQIFVCTYVFFCLFLFFNLSCVISFFIFLTLGLFILFIYLFMAVLGLCFCARAFSSCGKWGPRFIAVHGPLIIAASLVAEHRLQTCRLSNCGSWA